MINNLKTDEHGNMIPVPKKKSKVFEQREQIHKLYDKIALLTNEVGRLNRIIGGYKQGSRQQAGKIKRLEEMIRIQSGERGLFGNEMKEKITKLHDKNILLINDIEKKKRKVRIVMNAAQCLEQDLATLKKQNDDLSDSVLTKQKIINNLNEELYYLISENSRFQNFTRAGFFVRLKYLFTKSV